MERAVDPAAPDGGGGAPCRPRRLPARGDRRGDHAPADGDCRGLARLTVAHEVEAGPTVIATARGKATVTAAMTASRWPPAWSLRSGQLTVNSFCMPMKACGVPSGPEMKHSAA